MELKNGGEPAGLFPISLPWMRRLPRSRKRKPGSRRESPALIGDEQGNKKRHRTPSIAAQNVTVRLES
jgi:hypothetical protein